TPYTSKSTSRTSAPNRASRTEPPTARERPPADATSPATASTASRKVGSAMRSSSMVGPLCPRRATSSDPFAKAEVKTGAGTPPRGLVQLRRARTARAGPRSPAARGQGQRMRERLLRSGLVEAEEQRRRAQADGSGPDLAIDERDGPAGVETVGLGHGQRSAAER